MARSGKGNHVQYVWIPVIAALLAVPLGFMYVSWNKAGEGAGLYSRQWQPDAVFSYWNPGEFYRSVDTVQGVFSGEQCVQCHAAVTPGIVKDWRLSRHSTAAPGKKPVYCLSCHGDDHQDLHMPTPDVCAGCHAIQHSQFVDEKRYGFPSHALAMERAVDARHFVDKPKPEVTSCLQCHSVATKCDSCHTRHRFSAAEARRSEACITCHSGPPHPDDETFFASAHGKIYRQEGENWDWSKPLRKGNYKSPTCAYCHMAEGKHQVADKSIWKFGILEINPDTSANEVRRRAWIKVCSDCHEAGWSRDRLEELDTERKRAWRKLYEAEDLIKDLRSEELLYPAAGERPLYPVDVIEKLWPRERIGFYEGQASAFYNVSPIERDYFDMWYFDNLGAYKGAAHGAPNFVTAQHQKMDQALKSIKQQAKALRTAGEQERLYKERVDPSALWKQGEYTEYNKEHN
ncbi:MAG: hydroxylamine oxidoreductase [Gammaproteobacteria bacterium]|nr:hydroxylamine oxidoreductase [Gammaproteobacteria bacterium]